MNQYTTFGGIVFFILLLCGGLLIPFKGDYNRQEEAIVSNWEFSSDSLSWLNTKLPHAPRIEPLVVNEQWQGDLWYKKSLQIQDLSTKYFLEFEGVMHEARLWVNGASAGNHAGGYLPFFTDISDYLIPGQNQITLWVNNQDNPSIPPGKPLNDLDFNYYGGIYRQVNLIKTNKLHITHALQIDRVGGGGALCHFDSVSQTSANGSVRVHVKNEQDQTARFRIKATLTDPQDQALTFYGAITELPQNSDADITINLNVEDPFLWSVKTPHLYTMKIELFDHDDHLVDDFMENIGIRKVELTPYGFFLNDEKIYLRGTNRHQEYPYIGYAISKNANYRDALKIKQAGFDFVRLSHYPQDEDFLKACDELGILVMNAIPGWQFFGDQEFIENSYQDIQRMVRRDRNHPSVVFWEVSLNESSMTEEYMITANQILKKELPFRDTYSAGWIDNDAFDLYIPARQHGKAPNYWNNYRSNDRPLFIAEYGDWEYYAQNAGFNQSNFKNLKADERNSRQLRSYGERRLLQQALNFQEAANSNRKGSNTIGHANWLMFDYNRGYADDIEASGISDIFRIPKFAYYFYQSQRPAEDTLALKQGAGPMVKIASYWNADSNPNVRVYSNCEEVELYLNDSLVSKSRPNQDMYSTHLAFPPFQFDLGSFTPGKLSAIGKIGGKTVCKDVVCTSGNPKSIRLFVDNFLNINETDDLIIVHAEVVDSIGSLSYTAQNKVEFELFGEGRLLGKNPVEAVAGVASILYRGDPSKLNIRARSHQLNSDEIMTAGKN
ncbi:MAG: glycoside hydrolase family 2 TIM barrel-domain containing protein [Bacteroidota bacterium]